MEMKLNHIYCGDCLSVMRDMEDNGFSKEITEDIGTQVEIESIRQQSFNVAMAGTLVMYDRIIKQKDKII